MKNTLKDSNSIYRLAFIFLILLSFSFWFFNCMNFGPNGPSYDLFFKRGNDFMADTTNVVGYSAGRDVYNDTHFTGTSEKAYPPLQYVLSWMLSKTIPSIEKYYEINHFLGIYKESSFLVIYLIIYAAITVFLYETIRSVTIGNNITKICTACSILAAAPMIYAMERANSIILVIAFVTVYIFNYDSKNKYRKELALISLAIAAAFKITPALLGILLIYDKKWKEAVRTIIYGIIFFFAPFIFIQGGFHNIPLFIRNITMNLDSYGITEGVTLTSVFTHAFLIHNLDAAIKVFKPITYIASALMLIAAPLFKRHYEKIIAVTLTLVILPSHSGNYCILFLIPAILAFLNEKEHEKYDILFFIGFMTILLTYFNYYQQLLMGELILIVLSTLLSVISIFEKLIKLKTIKAKA